MGSSGSYTQEKRFITLTTPLGDDVLLLSSFTGHEGISRLFSFNLDMLSEKKNITFSDIVGQKVTISLELSDGTTERYFNGYVSRFSQSVTDATFTHYQMEVVPWLWFLTRTADCRIFQNMGVPDILQKVFDDCSVSLIKNSLTGTYAPLDYCVQYRETDFNFISRLMEHNGIYYFFEHEDDKHTLVLADSPSAHTNCPVQSSVRYAPNTKQNIDDVVIAWQIEQELRTGKYTLTDYNFETPSANLVASETTVVEVGGNSAYELFDYPGDHDTQSVGTDVAKLRMQEEEASHQIGGGSSTCRTLASGYLFDLEDHDCDNMNQTYLITEVQHSASVSGSFGFGGTDAQYSNHFSCIESSIPYRPARLTPKPFVQGPQTAVVVGPSGQEIYVDKYGRVKVQFFWDRLGKSNENSSCWIRVSQPWAAQGWGVMFIPRIGQEVIVSFLEGDPDRPIITGRVYNADQTVPYTLPDHDTISTVQSRSSPNGSSSTYNEIRFEDKKGSEQIFINAEMDMDHRVENDSREYIGHDRHLIVNDCQFELVNTDKHLHVKGNQFEQIDTNESIQIGGNLMEKITGNQSVNITGDRKESITGNDSRSVTGDVKENVTGNVSLTVTGAQSESITSDFSRSVTGSIKEMAAQGVSQQIGQDYNQQAGQNVNVTAGMNINLMGGMAVNITGGSTGVSIVGPGGFISITEAGVAIMGTLVLINSGGSPTPANPAVPQSPSSPSSPDSPDAPTSPTDPFTADDGSKRTKLS